MNHQRSKLHNWARPKLALNIMSLLARTCPIDSVTDTTWKVSPSPQPLSQRARGLKALIFRCSSFSLREREAGRVRGRAPILQGFQNNLPSCVTEECRAEPEPRDNCPVIHDGFSFTNKECRAEPLPNTTAPKASFSTFYSPVDSLNLQIHS